MRFKRVRWTHRRHRRVASNRFATGHNDTGEICETHHIRIRRRIGGLLVWDVFVCVCMCAKEKRSATESCDRPKMGHVASNTLQTSLMVLPFSVAVVRPSAAFHTQQQLQKSSTLRCLSPIDVCQWHEWIHFLVMAATHGIYRFPLASHFSKSKFSLYYFISMYSAGGCSHKTTILSQMKDTRKGPLVTSLTMSGCVYSRASARIAQNGANKILWNQIVPSPPINSHFTYARCARMFPFIFFFFGTNEIALRMLRTNLCGALCVLTNIKSLRNIPCWCRDRGRSQRLRSEYIFVFIRHKFSNASHHAIDDRKSFR